MGAFDIDDVAILHHAPMATFTTSLAATPQPSPFGLVVPGLPVRTDFVTVDATKFSLSLTCPGDITVPLATIRDLCFFCQAPLPSDQGVLVYWQIATPNNGPSTGFELLGSLTPGQPSAIFQTGWAEHEQLVELAGAPALLLTIGVSIEPLANLQNLSASVPNRQLFVAQKIARDLFNFMQSFDTGAAAGYMSVPTNIFDRWWRRFEQRFQRDPQFFLKSNDE